jgi:hypothetical protein
MTEAQAKSLGFALSVDELKRKFDLIQSAGPNFVTALNAVNVQMEQGYFTAPQYSAALTQLANAATHAAAGQVEQYDATINVIGATQEAIAKQVEDAQAKDIAAISASELGKFQQFLADIAQAVASGLVSDAGAAEVLASRYNLATDAALALVRAQERIMLGEARIRNQATATRDDSGGLGFNSPGRKGTGDVDAAIRGMQDAKKAAEDAKKAEQDLQQGRAERRGQEIAGLKKLQNQHAVGSAEYLKLQNQIEAAEEKAAKATQKGGAKKASAAKTAADKIEEIKIKEGEKLADAEEKNQQKLLDIQLDFAQKYAEQVRDNEISKRTSRADFYENLLDAPEGVDTAGLSAAYEQAFAEAQAIAQSGRAKLADEFLQLRTEQIDQLAQLDKKRKEIEEDDQLGSKEKEAKLAQLDAVRKLREDAQAEELKQLQEGGDALVNELNEKLTEEEDRYNQNVDKVQTAAERAADARIRAWQRANGVINGMPAAELQGFPQQPVPTSPAQTTKTAVPIETANAAPIPITTQSPIQVQATTSMPVFDQALFNRMNDVVARIEVGMGNIVAAINNNTNVLSSKLDGVESSVRRIGNKGVLAG